VSDREVRRLWGRGSFVAAIGRRRQVEVSRWSSSATRGQVRPTDVRPKENMNERNEETDFRNRKRSD